MIPVLEAVPNFSDGRDPAVLASLVAAVQSAGAEVLDASADPDHNRSVITLVGDASQVEQALVSAARVAVDRIDLRTHEGCHPRIGALDVCPIVPLQDASMEDAIVVARKVAAGIEALGVPVYLYGAASPENRRLSELRRGGVEALRSHWPEGRRPDLAAGRAEAHPSAGVSCVGARPLLLAWNLWVSGVTLAQLREIAAQLREQGGGIPGLRTLALELPRQEGLQLSMNLEEVDTRDPFAIFLQIEGVLEEAGGRIERTEVIGMIPDALVFPAAAHRLRLSDFDPARVLGTAVRRHRLRRADEDAAALARWVLGSKTDVPEKVRDVARRWAGHASSPPFPGAEA